MVGKDKEFIPNDLIYIQGECAITGEKINTSGTPKKMIEVYAKHWEHGDTQLKISSSPLKNPISKK